MKVICKIFILTVIVIFELVMNQNDFDNVYSIDFTLINKVNITTSISNQEDLGKCQCDLTENTCDYLCCCDNDCSPAVLAQWASTLGTCLDTMSSIKNPQTTCLNKNILYGYNRKRGMNDYTYTNKDRSLFCVQFDDSSIMDGVRKTVANYNTTQLQTILVSYVSTVSIPYYNSLLVNNSLYSLNYRYTYYLIDDPIALHNSAAISNYELTFFIQSVGPYGECEQNGIIKFWKNIPPYSCLLILSPLSSCVSNGWENAFSVEISSYLTQYSNYIGVEISSVYIKNMVTGSLTDVTGQSPATGISYNTDTITCSCTNFLLEAHVTVVMFPATQTLSYLYLDLVLADSITGICNNQYMIENKFSYTFTHENFGFLRSGNPGYNVGSNLLVGTLSDTNFILLRKYGFFVQGRNNNGSCLNSGTDYLNDIDFSIKFGENIAYSCQQSFNSQNDFSAFCNAQSWQNLLIFTNADNINLLGIFGNAKIGNYNDWYNVLIDYNLLNSTFVNNICYFPSTLVLDIQYSQGGIITNPQKYIVSARLYTIYNSYKFVSDTLKIDLKFIINYISLDVNMYNKVLPNASILPRLPSDIADPFVKK